VAALRFETRSSDSPWIDTVGARLGYFDQPHLARALCRYNGTGGALGLSLDQPLTS
jgi:hypothetical protein